MKFRGREPTECLLLLWGMVKPVEKVTEYPSGVLANRRLGFRLRSYVLKRLNS